MGKKVQIKINDLIKIQCYGEDASLGTVTKIEGDKIFADNGHGEIFENDADDCELITEADAIAQGLL